MSDLRSGKRHDTLDVYVAVTCYNTHCNFMWGTLNTDPKCRSFASELGAISATAATDKTMSKARKKIMDALEGGLSDDEPVSSSKGETSSSGEGSDSDTGSGQGGSMKKVKSGGGKPVAAKKQKTDLTLDDLEAAGFSTGPSVMYMKAPEEQQQGWNWSDGKAQKGEEVEEETLEERQRTREAATTGAEQGATLAMRGAAHSAKLREEAREERQRLQAEKQLTYNQKEKRKRNAGQATKSKNFVEEEKRLQRNFGVYSGFD